MSSDIQNMTHFFGWSYLAVGVMAILSGISNMFQSQHRLLYSAWLPFDWHNSALAFCIAGSFQLLALFFCIAQNFADDSFPPISLRLLTGHLSCLEFRVSTIGHRSFDHPYRIVMLQPCIQDQLALYEYCKQIENIISMPLLILFTLTGLNTGLALAAVLFVAEGFFNYMYYIVYSFAVLLRIFPVCYYGSQLQLKFQQLHKAVYFSNWIEEERAFKKDMIVFTERTLKMQTIYAGGLFRIHMDTFFSCCKAAYSMLAMFLKLKA
ncbi:odorant receptor 59a-like [Teleopsis dalmanni]|uniref:odorant receptor 59a-like n=1 Tax=Teleopsis dalmanni TaxID=139649 RepID=UPI0018CDD53F|nr:odorant receptor 59a-like [Teleopsis dalmanni]